MQQPYINRFHRTRSDEVLGESSFADPLKVRNCANIEECLRFISQSSSLSFRLPSVPWGHCALGDGCRTDVLISLFAHFFGATSGAFVAVSATPWIPHVFLKAARLLPHPFQDVALDHNILQLCFDNVIKGQDFVMAQRLKFFQKWTARAQQLRAAEIKFHKSLRPVVEKVVHKQQFLVLLEMLQELGFPKCQVLVQLMYTGFPFIGQLEETHIFERRVPPCTGRFSRRCIQVGLADVPEHDLALRVTANPTC